MPGRTPPPKKAAAEAAAQRRRTRARGALLGLAVGDALGATTEERRLAAHAFPTLALGPHTELVAVPRLKLQPGQVTDDTHMACCVAHVLKVRRAYLDQLALTEYLAWRPHAVDIGPQTASVLDEAARRNELTRVLCARELWLKDRRAAAGNGSMMRVAPLAVALAEDLHALTEAALDDSALTHYAPLCQLACAALCGALAAALVAPGDVDPRQMVDGAKRALTFAAASLGKRIPELVSDVASAAEVLREELTLAEADDPLLYGPDLHLHVHRGAARVTFRLAFWELWHAPSLEAGLLDVVNRGADAGTNAATTGALLGARFGEDAIPERWRTTVLDALMNARPGPLRDRYHPRQLLELADA